MNFELTFRAKWRFQSDKPILIINSPAMFTLETYKSKYSGVLG